MNLAVTKTRLKGAQTGHSLLKKKSDALNKVYKPFLSFLSLSPPTDLFRVGVLSSVSEPFWPRLMKQRERWGG